MSGMKHVDLAPGITAGVRVVEQEGIARAEIDVRASRKRVQASAVQKAMGMVDEAWRDYLLRVSMGNTKYD